MIKAKRACVSARLLWKQETQHDAFMEKPGEAQHK